MNNLNFIPARPQHFEGFYRLKSELDSIFWAGFDTAPDYISFQIHFYKELEKTDRKIFFLFIDDELAGYVIVFIHSDHVVETAHGVAKAFAGQGLGQALIKYAIDYSVANIPDAEHIIGWIAEGNIASVKNVLSNGYIKTGDVDFRTFQQEENKIKFEKYIRTLR